MSEKAVAGTHPTCVRVRIEGMSESQIRTAASQMGVVVVRVFPSKSGSGYKFYGYGNSQEKFER